MREKTGFRLQSLILVLLILLSLTLTRIGTAGLRESEPEEVATPPTPTQNLSYERDSVSPKGTPEKETPPSRNWDILDPEIGAQGILIQSLDENFPFLHYHTYQEWPIASLTKLLTAVVVLEEYGEDKKIPITAKAVETEGLAGDLRSGEVYTARDLLRILLVTSSNDAAAAFEEYGGGTTKFVRLLNQKAEALGMMQTIVHDASGLSDLNVSTANDLLRLLKYIIEVHPEILNWTRTPHILTQPINNTRSRTLLNVNPFVEEKGFLGGKTGTHDAARENLVALFSLGKFRVVTIVLGSSDRVSETPFLLNWVKEAYAL